MTEVKGVVLKPGREKTIVRRHPWIFSGAIARTEGSPGPGDTVEVFSSGGRWLARGAFNAQSQITVRLYSWREDEPLDGALLADRLRRAIALRQGLGLGQIASAYRLVSAESDLLPGLIVDRYGDYLALQALSAGAERWKDQCVDLLQEMLSPAGIYERSDASVRDKEGLPRVAGVLAGKAPPALVEVQENGRHFLVDLVKGHKTGFYLDQRENRRKATSYCAGKDVLNAFSYTGGFGVYASVYGANSVLHLDSSVEALELARRNVELNTRVARCEHEFTEANAFAALRAFRAAGRTFDVIILDPPKFAESAGQLPRALNGYKDINLVAMQLLRPGGVLITFSCSGLVSAAVFQQVVWEAAVDAGRDAQVVERLSQGPDHPVLLTFPEGEYLKGLVIKV
jgi:23S rRNA (cytosine1962-C5)-methyltransferase